MTAINPRFAAAIVKAQGAIEGAIKGNANPAFRSKYADLGACWDACRDALQANDLAVLQPVVAAPPGYVGIKTVLVFGPTGETIEETASFPVKDPTNAQAAGSAITYGRRYSLCSWLGICPEDDDGNAASSAGKSAGGRSGGSNSNAVAAPVDTAALMSKLTAIQSRDEAKTFYSQVKAMVIPEPQKTQTLSKMADHIKGMK